MPGEPNRLMTEPLPDPFADQPDWAPQPPRPIEVLPAAGRVELRGRRVLVGLPGLGWRGDLRADERVVQNSRTYVPVIPEHEWYRAESDQVEVFAPLVPVERVWVETVGSRTPTTAPEGAASDSSHSTHRHIGCRHRSSRPTRWWAGGWSTWSTQSNTAIYGP
ncbi:hypothetical protein Jiend_32530 [Micromonospora endophytica]|nr:hypothetical protein Jiend_32530 [Micromonospora endophytica]